MNHAKLHRNIIAALTQVLVTGVVFFMLYRFMYKHLGVDQIGIWSIVLASVSLSRLGDLGLSSAVVRHVANALGNGKPELATAIIETTTITLAVLMALVIAGCAIPLQLLLAHAVSPSSLPIALEILPYALLSLWFSFLSLIFQGALDGFQRIDLRAGVVIISTCIYLALTVVLVPDYGLKGVALAQIFQSSGSALVAWFLLCRQANGLPIIPYRWRYDVLKPLVIYGANIQLISIMSFLFDPVTKFVMSKFGGMSALGHYEMANKLVLQLRAVIVEANRVVVPMIAGASARTASQHQEFFLNNYRIVFFVSILCYSSLAILMPAITVIWTGAHRPELLQFAWVLMFGWFINTLIAPAFFHNLGSDRLSPNLYSQIIVGTCGIVFGWLGGAWAGGIGVVIGSTTGLFAGSIYLLWHHMKELRLAWPKSMLPEGISALVIIALTMPVSANYVAMAYPVGVALGISTAIFALWLLIIGSHKITRQLFRIVKK